MRTIVLALVLGLFTVGTAAAAPLHGHGKRHHHARAVKHAKLKRHSAVKRA